MSRNIILHQSEQCHSAIVVTSKIKDVSAADLPTPERSILSLIMSRMILAVCESLEYKVMTVQYYFDDVKLTAKFKNITSMGWKEVENNILRNLNILPKVAAPHTCDFKSHKTNISGENATVKNMPTVKYYTDGELMKDLKSFADNILHGKGIGTAATRANILERLIKSGYICRQNKNIIITEKGMSLAQLLPTCLTNEATVAKWEMRLSDIEKGLLSEAKFMEIAEKSVKSMVKGDDEKNCEPLGKCPICGSPVVEGKKAFYCENALGKHSDCTFYVMKDEDFFLQKGKAVTAELVKAFLKTGKVKIHRAYFDDSKEYFDCIVQLDVSHGFVIFRVLKRLAA